MGYIKSPLNYVGGKHKLLPQILPLFPKDIDTFVDIFTGGCNVAANVKANKKVCNDIESHVISLMKYFKANDGEYVVDEVCKLVKLYGLSDTSSNGYEYYGANSSDGVARYNKDKYTRLRDDYNKDTSNDLLFFTTVIFAFSNQIRFNQKTGLFNMPVNKRDFNNSVKKNTLQFVNAIDNTYYFTNKDFREINIDKLKSNDFVYLDPPYLVTVAAYNENGGWTEKDEIDLLLLLDKLNEKGIKFALSNVLTHKGKRNEILINWCEENKDKYIVHHLSHTYSNCNYHDKTGTSGVSDEVLICNYHKCGDCANFGDCKLDNTACEFSI